MGRFFVAYLGSDHYQAVLDAAAAAQLRLLGGAKMVTVNGQQYQFEDLSALSKIIEFAENKLVEVSGTTGADGRGAWEVAFSE